MGKTFTIDPISHKRLSNLGEADKHYLKEHHEPIISPEQFDLVQEILKERCGARVNGRRIGNVGRKFAFSSRIRCGFCGNCYTRRMVAGRGNAKIPSWSCTSFSKTGKENCTDSKTIREEMIKEAFVDSYKLLCSSIKFEKDKFLNDMEETINNSNKQTEIEKLNDPEYVAKYARENYLYTRDGEIVIKSIDTTEKAEELLRDMKKETLMYKYIIVGSAVGFILIIAIIKRR